MASSAVIVQSIADYLRSLKSTSDSIIKDADSLDVALQCLSEATGITANTAASTGPGLVQIYNAGTAALINPATEEKFNSFLQLLKEKDFFGTSKEGTAEYTAKLTAARAKYDAKYGNSSKSTPSDSDKKQAESLKAEANALLNKSPAEAIAKYTAAINLNNTSAIYYSNRAAAYINLKLWNEAVSDSEKSIQLDPAYSKAYYRLGSAQMQLMNYPAAISAFERGLKYMANDPDMHRTVSEQLQLAKNKLSNPLANTNTAAAGNDMDDIGAGAGGAGGFDFASMMNNPAIAELASKFGSGGAFGDESGGGVDFKALLNNPAIMNMAAGMFGGGGAGAGPAAAPAAAAAPSAGSRPSAGAGAGAGGSDPMSAFLNSPAAAQLRSDPELAEAMADVEANGQGAMMKYMSNPRIMNKLSSILGPLMGGGGKK